MNNIVITPAQMVEMMLDKMAELDKAIETLREALHFEAKAEREYREFRIECWLNLPEEMEGKASTAAQKEAFVDANAAAKRETRDRATAESKVWYEKVRALRQGLSMLQTASNSIKQEMGFEQTRPDWEMEERYGKRQVSEKES